MAHVCRSLYVASGDWFWCVEASALDADLVAHRLRTTPDGGAPGVRLIANGSLAAAELPGALDALHLPIVGLEINQGKWTGRPDRPTVDVSVLRNLTELTSLKANACTLEGSFKHLVDLKLLQSVELIDCCSIVPRALLELPELTSLDLSYNNWLGVSKSMRRVLGKLTGLRSLALTNSNVTSTSMLSGLSKLESLDLQQNYELQLSNSLSALTSLTFLELGETGLAAGLPDWFSCLTSLRYLGLDSGEIGHVPPVLSSLSSLTYLRMSWQGIGDGDTAELPTQLKRLELIGNSLTYIPATFNALTALSYLNVEYNAVRHGWRSLLQLPLLHTLCVGGTARGIPASVYRLCQKNGGCVEVNDDDDDNVSDDNDSATDSLTDTESDYSGCMWSECSE